MNRVLITGATGFVGRNLIPQIYGDMDVAILVRDEEKAKKIFREYKSITIINQNEINYKDKIREFNLNIVVHMASNLTSKRDEKTINELIDVNIKLGTHLLDALEGVNVEYFINVGTSVEYMNNDNNLVSANLYSATKTAFRKIIEYYQDIYKFKWINVIPYTIYGGEDTRKKVIDLIVDSLNSPKPIEMTKGEQILDFIHVEDVNDFFVKLLNNIESVKYEYVQMELGTGTGTSIRELTNKIEKIFDGKCNIQWGAIPYRERDVMKSVANVNDNILGWKPKINLDEGIRKMKYEFER